MAEKIDLSIVIPCFNESQRITHKFSKSYQKIKELNLNFEIILVDDGSTDNTKQVLRNLAKQYKNVSVISYSQNQGKGYAVKKGIEQSTGEVVGFMDADFAISLDELPRFLEVLKSGADLCIPDRNDVNSHASVKQSTTRQIVGRVLSFLNNILLGLGNISDTQCGFKFFKHSVAKQIFEKLTIKRWMFDLEVILIAKKLNYKIAKLPVNWEGVAESKVSIGKDLYSVFKDLGLIYSTFFNIRVYIFILSGFLILILLPFIFSPSNLTHRNGDFSDLVWPDYFFIKNSILNQGQIPLWNPTLFSGIPEIANPQSPLIYPPNILALILPIDIAIVLLIFIHSLVGGIYLFKTFRKIFNWSNLSSVLGSFVFILSPFLWSKFSVGHLSQGFAICLLGPILYYGLSFYQKYSVKTLVLFSIILSLQYLNYPTIWYYTLFFGFPVLGYFSWLKKRLRIFLFLAISAAFSLIWIFPIFLIQLRTGDWITRTELNLTDLTIPIWSVSRFIHSVLISSNLLNDYETESWLYPSMVGLILGLLGFIKLKNIFKIPILISSIIVVLITLGGRTAIFGLFTQYIPGFSYLRVSTRDWFVVIVILAILVGWFFQTTKNKKSRGLLAVILILDLLFFSILRIWEVPDIMKPENAKDFSQFFKFNDGFRYYCTSRCLSARDSLPENIITADGYHLLILRNYRKILSRAGGFPLPRYTGNIPGYDDRFAQPDAQNLGGFSVKWVISQNLLTDPSLSFVDWQSGYSLYENQAALPRIRFVNSQNQIQVIHDLPNLIELKTQGFDDKLIIADSYLPGWYATIDGSLVDINLEDGWARSIFVPTGNHNIRFEYKPFDNLLTFSK